jgi:hypothetical protein
MLRFLSTPSLWTELTRLVRRTKKVRAAIAYMSSGAAKQLPLKKGDALLVDLSLRAVRQGVSNPFEVQKLRRKGVEVFTHDRVHAKFVTGGGWLLVVPLTLP